MKAVFFHDCKLLENKEGEYYTNGGLNSEYLKKYMEFCEELVMVTRKIKVEKVEQKYSACNTNNVFFDSINNLNLFSLLFGKSKRKIKQNLEKSNFAIVRLPSFIGYTAIHHAKKMKKPYIVELVGCPLDSLWYRGGITSKIIAPISYIFNKKYIKKAKNVVYVTEKFLQSRYQTEGESISCSDVNLVEINENILEKRIDKINNLNIKEKIIFGIIGNLNMKYKGQAIAIKALSNLKDKINFELHLLGNGETKNLETIALKYGIADKVYFDGTLPGGKPVYEWMDNIDVFLIPSLTEGLPRALIEAMSRASITIGSNVGGIPELIGNNLIFKKKDDKELKEIIEQIIMDKERMKNIAIDNYKKSLSFDKTILDMKKTQFFQKFVRNI